MDISLAARDVGGVRVMLVVRDAGSVFLQKYFLVINW